MESTTNYEQFKTIRGNRDVFERHVEDLVAVIKKKNLLQYFPLLLNEKMEIIDGQHRLAAANILGVKIWYVVIPGLTLDDVMSINTHNKSWTLMDFISAHIRNGKKQYQTLMDFSEKYSLGLQVSARLIHGATGSNTTSDNLSKVVKRGEFQLNHLEWATMIAEQLHELEPFCDDVDTKRERNFIYALAMANRSPNFDFQQFLAKLKLHHLKIVAKSQVRFYLLEIEELYNFRNRKYIDIYASSRNGKMAVEPTPDTTEE